MIDRADRLCPPPQALELQPGRLRLGFLELEITESFAQLADFAESLLAPWLESGRSTRPRVPLRVRCEPSVERPEGYRLHVAQDQIVVEASRVAGARHALRTLYQWLGPEPGLAVPCVRVEDWPCFQTRGVMLDISRGKVPKIETLHRLIDLLSLHKINHFQLYMEHTFAYSGHEDVWRDWSPLTPEDVRGLDTYCRRRGVELVPNQNSFGHFHRWLVHDRYRPLAECPEGIIHPFAPTPEPFSLCPEDPGSLALLEDLYDQLLPCFESRLFNVGLDETFDLGKGRSQARCEEFGRQSVYLDFLAAIEKRVRDRDHRMLFWADIVLSEPGSLRRLSADALPLLWGYSARHPFEEQCEALARTGREFWVCPGTSSWNSFAGRLENSSENITHAVEAAKRHGARGILITDWGDNGHLQTESASLPGFLLGAALSWNGQAGDRAETLALEDWVTNWQAGTGTAVADARILARATLALARLAAIAGPPRANSSPLFDLLVFCHERLEDRGLELSLPALEEVREETARVHRDLDEVSPAQGSSTAEELRWTADILALAADLGCLRLAAPQGVLAAIPGASRAELSARLRRLVTERRRLWLKTNRPGGLDYALGYLDRVVDRLREGLSPGPAGLE